MKKTLLICILLAAFVIMPAAAQDFTSARPQFLSFSFGVPIGFSANSDVDGVLAGQNFSLNFTVIENLTVGIDKFIVEGDGFGYDAIFMRIAYLFTDEFGASISFGDAGGEAGIGFGAFANLFQNRTRLGLTHAIQLRLDYLAQTDNFGDGVMLFTIGASLGL
ncbi:MAG: hypothetical protein FWC36_01865 [Spirochaetes bacterium]|nr:hypothetical protein [Spirochaetota bacterium]